MRRCKPPGESSGLVTCRSLHSDRLPVAVSTVDTRTVTPETCWRARRLHCHPRASLPESRRSEFRPHLAHSAFTELVRDFVIAELLASHFSMLLGEVPFERSSESWGGSRRPSARAS